MVSSKTISKNASPVKKRGGIGITNGEQAEDLGRKFNLIVAPGDMGRLPADGDGGLSGSGGLDSPGGGSSYIPGSGCAMLTKITSINYTGSRRQEVFQVGPVVDNGFKYTLMVYSHGVEVKADPGDSPTVIASKMAAAINGTTAGEWNDHSSAPATGTPGFKPTATSSGNTVTVILNQQNSFAAWADGCNNVSAPEPPAPGPTNQAPIARAGNAITIQAPESSVQLDGTTSSDPENGALEFSWAMVEGPNAPAITGSGTARPTITNLVPGHYTFRLTVFDAQGASSSNTVNVTVNASVIPPPADNGDTEPKPEENIPKPSPVLDTAPVLTQYFGPFGPMGGGGGAAAPQPGAGETATTAKKTNWLLWAFIAASATYIIFAPNK